jgi:cytochrome c-type biogenesis protein CcmH/NrfF
MVCPKCGTENRKGVNFCTACGGALKKAPHVQRRAAFSGRWSSKAIAAGVGTLIIAVGLAVFISRGMGPDRARQADATSKPVARPVSLAVRNVASKFICGCGECDNLDLADCTCPSAIEGRELIDRELKRKTPEQEVIKLVNGRYGRIKLQYASLVAGASSEPPAATPAPAKPSGGIATEADARWIASQFICPCGQCQDHALSECDCRHPKGATEIKAFIQYKISQKRHTAEEIVKAVAGEYGRQIKG